VQGFDLTESIAMSFSIDFCAFTAFMYALHSLYVPTQHSSPWVFLYSYTAYSFPYPRIYSLPLSILLSPFFFVNPFDFLRAVIMYNSVVFLLCILTGFCDSCDTSSSP